MSEPLHEFFAVTVTSIYRVSDEKDSEGTPIVQKVRMRFQSIVGTGKRLMGGSLVGIRAVGLLLYSDGKENTPHAKPEDIAPVLQGSKSSPLVGLFRTLAEAETCIREENTKVFDSRWQKQTADVLRAIGTNHPVFVVGDLTVPKELS